MSGIETSPSSDASGVRMRLPLSVCIAPQNVLFSWILRLCIYNTEGFDVAETKHLAARYGRTMTPRMPKALTWLQVTSVGQCR